jgi:hypothetical protein
LTFNTTKTVADVFCLAGPEINARAAGAHDQETREITPYVWVHLDEERYAQGFFLGAPWN